MLLVLKMRIVNQAMKEFLKVRKEKETFSPVVFANNTALLIP
jgi:hypothetical protein